MAKYRYSTPEPFICALTSAGEYQRMSVPLGGRTVIGYVPDFLTGKKEKNRGQLEMYLVENAHEPIIDRETFDRVQEMKGHIKHTVQIEQML